MIQLQHPVSKALVTVTRNLAPPLLILPSEDETYSDDSESSSCDSGSEARPLVEILPHRSTNSTSELGGVMRTAKRPHGNLCDNNNNETRLCKRRNSTTFPSSALTISPLDCSSPPRVPPPRKQQRRISFQANELDLDSVAVQIYWDERDAPLQPLWYTLDELKVMKQAAKQVCRQRRELEHVLNDAYFYCTNVMTTANTDNNINYTNDAENGSCTHEQQQQQQHRDSVDFAKQLVLNAPFFHEQRGMERWSSQRQAVSRGLTIIEVKTEVFLAQATGVQQQQQQQQQPSFHNTNNQHHLSSTTAQVAQLCEMASRPAVRFARFLGELDEIVAKSSR